ncbi:MAG TPA: type II CAAX endopeptidase family protein [Verrucomicrobiae bacterium]|jgi:hypothetical protein
MRWIGVELAEKPWNLEAAARLLLGIMATLCLGTIVAGMANHFMTGWPKAQSDFWQIVISASFLEFPALAWIGWFLRRCHIGWKDAFGLHRKPFTALGFGILLGILFVPVAWELQNVSDQLMKLAHMESQEQPMVQQLQQPGMTALETAFMGMLALALAPAVEELFFRGILYPAIRRTGHPAAAFWVTSILFALAHWNAATFVPLLVFSALLIYLYECMGNLLAPIAAHSLFNATNFFVLIFQNQIIHALHALH